MIRCKITRLLGSWIVDGLATLGVRNRSGVDTPGSTQQGAAPGASFEFRGSLGPIDVQYVRHAQRFKTLVLVLLGNPFQAVDLARLRSIEADSTEWEAWGSRKYLNLVKPEIIASLGYLTVRYQSDTLVSR